MRSSNRSSMGIWAGLSHGRRGRRGYRTGRVTVRSDATVDPGHGFWEAMDTDSQLIVALARDLDGTFEALVLGHQDRLYSIALRMLGDPRDAEEAAQDAFVRAYRALAGYDAGTDPRAAPAGVAGHDRAQPVPDRGSASGSPPVNGRSRWTRRHRVDGPGDDAHEGPAAATDRRSAAETWAALPADPAARRTGARSCSATSTG